MPKNIKNFGGATALIFAASVIASIDFNKLFLRHKKAAN
jgi:hypothetical protein